MDHLRVRILITELICYLFILLFVYAAVSKFLDYENFQVQLGQSPLLSAFAGWVAWMVPVGELIVSVLLLIPAFRMTALFMAYSIMTLFTAYIYIILNYSSYVPCSCGGILEEMGWTEHIIFNIFFMLLAVIAIMLYSTPLKTAQP